jgi:hypothetical protein
MRHRSLAGLVFDMAICPVSGLSGPTNTSEYSIIPGLTVLGPRLIVLRM